LFWLGVSQFFCFTARGANNLDFEAAVPIAARLLQLEFHFLAKLTLHFCCRVCTAGRGFQRPASSERKNPLSRFERCSLDLLTQAAGRRPARFAACVERPRYVSFPRRGASEGCGRCPLLRLQAVASRKLCDVMAFESSETCAFSWCAIKDSACFRCKHLDFHPRKDAR
jgi:hypothetical protein